MSLLPVIPPAAYHGPTCPICEGELASDPDIHQCEACSLYWPVDDPDADGEAEELDGPRCGEEHRPYTDDGYTIDDLFKGAVYRCIRLAAHRDDDPAVCAGIKVAGLDRITNTLTWRTKGSNGTATCSASVSGLCLQMTEGSGVCPDDKCERAEGGETR